MEYDASKSLYCPNEILFKTGAGLEISPICKRALDEWHKVSNGKVSFIVVDNLLSSNINIDWKRVERQALGHCYFQYDKSNRLYSAEVAIGLTEGLVHADYMDEEEVYHTIYTKSGML